MKAICLNFTSPDIVYCCAHLGFGSYASLKGIQEHVKKYTHLTGTPANLSANIPASCLRPARTGAAYAHSVRLDGHVRRTLGQLERVRSSVGRPSLMRLCPVVRRPAAAFGRAPVPRHAARARGDWAAAVVERRQGAALVSVHDFAGGIKQSGKGDNERSDPGPRNRDILDIVRACDPSKC